jgi:hypothetical protein
VAQRARGTEVRQRTRGNEVEEPGWYIKGGFQWYDLINNNLVISENESVGCAYNLNESCKTSRSIWVGFVGIGAHF